MHHDQIRLGDGEIVVPAERGGVPADQAQAVPQRYRAYVGKYTGPEGAPFTVKVDNDALVIDVEGRVALPMLDPDADGVWRCKLTPGLYVVFDRDEAGTAATMWVHEIVTMRKTADAEEVGSNVPEALRGHLGTYLLPQANMEFTAAWRQATLALRQGDSGGFSLLWEDPDEAGTWVSQETGNRITFDVGADGGVAGLTLDSASRVVRR